MSIWSDDFAIAIEEKVKKDNLRKLLPLNHDGDYLIIGNKKLLNLASNDYLGLGSSPELVDEFLDNLAPQDRIFSSTSSRLLTGGFEAHERAENTLAELFDTQTSLIFNSGYHMNLGILSAICDKDTLVLADKLIHASMIDGLMLAPSKLMRFAHNDINHLSKLLEKYTGDYKKVLIVTESIYSMDGDIADIKAMVALKKQYKNVALYVDEAHAIGVRGKKGLGIAEEYDCIKDIDFLVGTFGKAIHSMGGYIVCDNVVREYLVNYMRPLIFSTALPPISLAFTDFILKKLDSFENKRQNLAKVSNFLISKITEKYGSCPSNSHIVPVVTGSNESAINKAKELQENGLYVSAIRPPTVPVNQARLRISLTANINQSDVERLVGLL